jgi:predicted porin
MKKTQVALAALALVASTAALADGVKISGQIDLGVMHTSKSNNGAGGTFMEQGALLDHSSVNISANEDLGSGMKAFTTLELGFNANGFADNGGGANNTTAGAGALFNRQAFVGVSGEFGSVAFGRQLSPFILSQALTNFGVGSFWVNRLAVGNSSGGAFSVTGTGVNGSGFFPANGISYTSPSIGGFTVRGLTTTAQGTQGNVLGADAAAVDNDRFDSASIEGNVGPAFVSGAWQSNKNTYTSYTLGATAKVSDSLSVMANYMNDKPEGGTSVSSTAVGVKYSLSGSTDAILQYAANDASGNSERTLTNLSLVHALSKRTSVYAMAASGKNVGSTIGNFANDYAGKTNTSYGIGVAHSF